ncbi:MAG TPA: hypothetical protein VF299_02460 [Mycobacterium sp.]
MNAVVPAPGAVRTAGLVVAIQGAAALAIAVALVLRGLVGADQRVVNGFATAVWFALAGACVLAASWALLRGRRWGRGVAVFTDLVLLPIAWNLGVGSHRWGYGVLVGVSALVVLALLFSPPALRWATGR